MKRDTEWQQGSILINEDACNLGLLERSESAKRAVVITHDCDLRNSKEQFIEVIIGTEIVKPVGMFENARHPRTLHLMLETKNGEVRCIELQHAYKKQICNKKFIELKGADLNFVISKEEKRTLKQWLAARYGRPAFPNEFEKRLRKKVKKDIVERCIAHILEPISRFLVGLFLDLGDQRFVELDDEPYVISMFIVYDTNEGEVARENAELAVKQLNELFREAYGTIETTKEIGLERCSAIADTYMTLADLRKVDQWRLEYISLGEDPPSDFFGVGERSA